MRRGRAECREREHYWSDVGVKEFSLKKLRVGFNRGAMTRTVEVGGQGSKMLGREWVTGIGRMWNLGAVHGDRGRAKYLRVLHLVPDVSRERRRKETEERKG